MWLPPWLYLFGGNVVLIFFIYGLAFFALGLAIFLEARHATSPRSPFAQNLWLLAAFAFIHSVVEWLEMFHIVHVHGFDILWGDWLLPSRIFLLALSSLFLSQFGAQLIISAQPRFRLVVALPTILFAIWLVGWVIAFLQSWAFTEEGATRTELWTRYLLYFPGSILSAWGLLAQRATPQVARVKQIQRDYVRAAFMFLANAIAAGLIVPPAPFFPASLLNTDLFIAVTGIPIQVLRGLLALAIAFYVTRILKVFEVERRAEFEQMNAQLQMLSGQVISAQEEERKRIARDLHDDVAQALSALLVRLRLVERGPLNETDRVALLELRELTARTWQNVSQLAHQLRPSDLDDMGLVAALDSQLQIFKKRYGLAVEFRVEGLTGRLPAPVELILYRIVQEALTNVARHAVGATRVQVVLARHDHVIRATVSDDGQGFDVSALMRAKERGLGLFGMRERAGLVGGTFQIESRLGAGTCVTVEVSLDGLK